jgi:outer membrane lipoprotein-sorting protein
VTSNKNSNKYILKQTYQSPNISIQEVVEPSNIAGERIENDGTNLKLENSQLNLNTILENYKYLGDNCLDLYSFIEDYKQDANSSYEEKETEIIMKASSNIENIYVQEKILHIDKKTYNPTQMEIKDNQQKTTIYILYNEVKVNSTK